jgi:hypothetical protein
MKNKFLIGISGLYLMTFVMTEKVQAFNLSGPTGPMTREYEFDSEYWYVHTKKSKTLPIGGTREFRNTFSIFFPQWKLQIAPSWSKKRYSSSLPGELGIGVYMACDRDGKQCGKQYSVGAVFNAYYSANSQDPLSNSNDIKWIQYVDANYTSNDCANAGIYDRELIDNLCKYGANDKPYYPAAYRSYVEDAPNIGVVYKNKEVYFDAHTYLAKETGSKHVRVYDGVYWGWKNKNSRKKVEKIALFIGDPPPGDPPDLPRKSCLERHNDAYYCGGFVNYASNSVLQENLNFTADPPQQLELTSNPDVESVPTPAMLPGLVATGVYHGRKWRKRKQQNHNSDNAAA